MMRRWDDGLPAAVRAEIMVEAYEPVLRILIAAGRRGKSPPGAMLRFPAAWR
jgi:hypothetical protein